MRAMDDSGPPSPGDGGGGSGGGGSTNTYSSTFDTNGLWLAIASITNGVISVNLNNATNQVYEIWSATSLTNAAWDIEQEVWPTNQTCMPFTVEIGDRTNALFFYARDWTRITENGNTTPDWWFYYWLGAIGFADTNLDSAGVPLVEDYENGSDPNVISFFASVTNQYANTSDAPVQLNVTAGWPSYLAVVVDDTNFAADANWGSYSGSNIAVNLGSMEGWHQVWIGLRGWPTNATVTWQSLSVNLDLTPPVLTITNPSNSVTSQPVLELQGSSDRPIAQINYNLQNAAGYFTNVPGLVTGQTIDAVLRHFAANSFQCYDIPLTNGLNTITLRVTDLAGNLATTNIELTLDFTGDTNPPAISVYWPQDGDSVAGTNITLRGSLDDFTASLTAQIVDTNGDTNDLSALVERNGLYWVENVPLAIGPNYITLTAMDAAGNISSTNLTVTNFGSAITIDDYSNALGGTPRNIVPTVTGSIALTNYTLWVNGIQATQNGDGAWQASSVPIGNGGTAVIEARAIPNTDNGGNGTGTAPATDGTPTNPTAADSVANQSEIDQPPYCYVAKYQDAGTWSSSSQTDCNACLQWYNDTSTWNCSGGQWSGGSDRESEVYENSDCHGSDGFDFEDTYTWPCDDCAATEVESFDGQPISTNQDSGCESWIGQFASFTAPMAEFGWAVQRTDFDNNCPGDTTAESGSGNTLSQTLLLTGGKGTVGLQNLFGLSATATEYYLQKTVHVSDGVGFVWETEPIDPSQVKILGQSQQNGAIYKVLPDNAAFDITPQAQPPCYTYSVGATKYKSYFWAYAVQPDTTSSYHWVWNPYTRTAGHAWWNLASEVPYNAFSKFASPSLLQFMNTKIGYWPLDPDAINPYTTSGPGNLQVPEPDTYFTAQQHYQIGFPELINALQYTSSLYQSPGTYDLYSNNCVNEVLRAGAAAGAPLPDGKGPKSFCNPEWFGYELKGSW